ncbi:MAG: kinase-like domain-containing protein [Piptocephalis tieghemiana]|nr:MAG: kinase-like domain-containing protein [Piptocephalis tieghemiana]
MIKEYKVDDECFRGGMSRIRPATNVLTNTRVVLKFYRDEKSFSREMDVLKQLKHTNVISMMASFNTKELDPPNPQPIMVLERGQINLRCYYQEHSPRGAVKVKEIFKDILSAIQVIHEAKFVHCDLKPENCLLFGSSATHVGNWKLIDFDSACKVGSEVVRGTVAFCAPEVIKASLEGVKVDADTSMDIFSMGQLLYWMTHEESIWGSDTTERQMTLKLISPEAFTIPTSPTKNCPSNQYILQLLCKDPSSRPAAKEITICNWNDE